MPQGDAVLLRLSVLEIRRLRDCAEREMHAGHWGSSDIIIPEYDYLYRTIQSADESLEMRIPYVRILVAWLAEATGYGSVLLREDESILRKLETALAQFRANDVSEKNPLMTSLDRVERDIQRLLGRVIPDEITTASRPDREPGNEERNTPVHEAVARRAPRRSLADAIRCMVHGKVIDPSDTGSLLERIGDAVRRFAERCKDFVSGKTERTRDMKTDAADAASYLKRTGKAVRALRKKGGW